MCLPVQWPSPVFVGVGTGSASKPCSWAFATAAVCDSRVAGIGVGSVDLLSVRAVVTSVVRAIQLRACVTLILVTVGFGSASQQSEQAVVTSVGCVI